MTSLINQKPERQFYIDWLRIILIFSVFLFHIGMVFNTWAWHVKNEEQYGGLLRYSMIFLHNWRMPLLFMISGAGTWFALGKRTPGQYIKERFLRLFIPFIIGIFTLVPVQVYVEKIENYGSLLDFYRHMFDGVYPEGNFSWHHLWFILYLFFIALLITPFLNHLRNARTGRFGSWCDRFFARTSAQYLVIVPLLLSQIILRRYFEVETHAFFNDWASMAYFIIFFMAGFFLLTSGTITESLRRNRYVHLLSVLFSTVVMFCGAYLFRPERAGEIVSDIAAIFLAWSCVLAATGFARHFLNFDSRFRKIANEAIYPFYLLHQPIIVITAYFVVNMNLGVMLKVFVLLLSSFTATISVYWFLIRPFNLLRVIFGMKRINRGRDNDSKKCLSESYECLASRA